LAANQGPPHKDDNELNRHDPKFISITFDDGKFTGKPQKFVPFTHVGTSPIKLPLKQVELLYEDSMVMKRVKFLEHNIVFQYNIAFLFD
jgi:hypothetical protein